MVWQAAKYKSFGQTCPKRTPYKSFGQACPKRTPYKSFGQAFSKACGNPKGKARGRLRRGETPLAHPNSKSKIKRRKVKVKNQKAQCSKKMFVRQM